MTQIQLFYFKCFAVLSMDNADDEVPDTPVVRGFFLTPEEAVLAQHGFESLRLREFEESRKRLPPHVTPSLPPRCAYAMIPVKDVMVDCYGPLSDLETKLEHAALLQLQGVGVMAA